MVSVEPSHIKYHGAALLLLALGLSARDLVANSSGCHIQHTTVHRFAAPNPLRVVELVWLYILSVIFPTALI